MDLGPVVLGTRNEAKRALYGRLLDGMAVVVRSLEEFDIGSGPSEIGRSAEENAEIKARFYAEQTGIHAFAEDEALYVDFLPAERQPGVHVRRITGAGEADDDALLAHWDGLISQAPEEARTGRWHIAYCIAAPGGSVTTTVHDYSIRFFSPTSKVSVSGWPLNRLQGPAMFSKPRSELTESEKQEWERITATYLECLLQEAARRFS